MSIGEAEADLRSSLLFIYDERECRAISDWAMEHLTGMKKGSRILNNELTLTAPQLDEFDGIKKELLRHKPIHYILQQAWFQRMKLFVNEHVLIPRPETEELVEWAETEIADNHCSRVLDVGTGSGCIALALKKRFPSLEVHACDVSTDALQVARENAGRHQLDIQFMHIDFLDRNQWKKLPAYDIVISNPPYIDRSEQQQIDLHVREYEPEIALFVPGGDALIFYRLLKDFATYHLRESGLIMVETHFAKAEDVANILKGFDVVIRKDMHGKQRMIKAQKPLS